MIRQSLVDERVSALHHQSLQSSGDSDGDMSKATTRRGPAPVASRIVIKKNSSLKPIGDETTTTTTNSPSTTPSPTPTVDPRSRVELLERNLRYVQQQHEITLADLHNEINRLQQENRDLHFRMIDIRPSSSSSSTTNKHHKKEAMPSIHQLADLTQSEPILEKRLQEVQRLHFEQQIDELRTRLIETEQKNEYLMRTIDQLNQASQASSSAIPVLLPDPNISLDAPITTSLHQNDSKINQIEPTQTTDSDFQHQMKISHDKQRQQTQEIARLRAVLREILNAERLSSTSKILVRDCLASTNINENVNTITTTPMDALYNTVNPHQRSIASSSTGGKALSMRHELPLRRLNLSPPQFIAPRSTSQSRPPEQRLILPPIVRGPNGSPPQDPTGAAGLLHSSLSQTNAGSQQQLLKLGETPVARRERRTQELQRTRLTRNLYH